MGLLSRLFFNAAPSKFTYIGSPAVFRGPNAHISSSCVSTVTHNGEAMKVHCVPAYISSLYIVEYPKRRELLLLDSGFPTDFARARFYVESIMKDDKGNPYSLKDNMKLVVVTHCHVDHAGASKPYHDLGVPIARASEMETTYQGPHRRFQMFAEAFLGTFVATRMQRTVEDPFTYSSGFFGPYWQFLTPAVAELGDAQELPCGFDDWLTVKVPGHTSHMIALYHRPSGLFYTSDMLVKLRKGFFPPQPVNYEWAYEHSLKRLREMDVQCALMAHGGIVKPNDFGSWNQILDQVSENFERSKVKQTNPSQHKQGGSRWSNLMGAASLRIFRSRSTETRHFTPDQLYTQAIPHGATAGDSRTNTITYDS